MLLNIQYSKKKQEIRHDPVMDAFFSIKDYLAANTRQLIIAVVTAVVAVAAFFLISAVMTKRTQAAQEAYGKAMIAFQKNDYTQASAEFAAVVEKHRRSPQAGYSAFMLGSISLRQAKYDEAIKWFEIAATGKGDANFVPGKANEGLAACYEAKGDAQKAYDYLDKALKDENLSFRAPALRWKMALIAMQLNKNDDARSFCKALASDTLAGEFQRKAENLLVEIQ
jgi:TolA-binding protein